MCAWFQLWSPDDSLQTASGLFESNCEDKTEQEVESGWGDDDDWGDVDQHVSAAQAAPPLSSHDPSAELTKEQKREERRLRQQAAKEKRAAGQAAKRTGLRGAKKLE